MEIHLHNKITGISHSHTLAAKNHTRDGKMKGEERNGDCERNEVMKGMRGKEVSDESYSIFTGPDNNVQVHKHNSSVQEWYTLVSSDFF